MFKLDMHYHVTLAFGSVSAVVAAESRFNATLVPLMAPQIAGLSI